MVCPFPILSHLVILHFYILSMCLKDTYHGVPLFVPSIAFFFLLFETYTSFILHFIINVFNFKSIILLFTFGLHPFVFIYVPLFGLALIFKWVFNFSIFVVQFRDYNMYPWFTKVLKLLILFTHLPYTDLSAKWVYFNSIIIKIMIHNFWSFIWFNI